MSLEGVQVNQIKNNFESARKVGSLFSEIALKLAERDAKGYNHLFAPNAAMKLVRIAEYLKTDLNPDLDNTLVAVEGELQEFGRHIGSSLSDNLGSLQELSDMFNGLSESLQKEKSTQALKMSKWLQGISGELKKRQNGVRAYLGS